MKFTLHTAKDGTPHGVTVEREKGDPSLCRGGYTPDGWALESVALGWVMRWLNKEFDAGLIRSSVGRDYERGYSHHLMEDELPLLRQPVKKYGKGGKWDVHVLNMNNAVQSCEDRWAAREPIYFHIYSAT